MITRRTRLMASIAAIVAGTLVLGACSNSSGGSGSPSEASSQSATASGPVTIKYLHRLPDGEDMTKVADIVNKWNSEHPDIQVETTKFPGKASELMPKLEADVKAGTAPCLVQAGYSEIPDMYVKGLVQDVTSEAEKYKGHFSGAYGQMSVGGKIVGLPQDTGPLVYVYNEAEFKKLGIEVPKTSQELLASAKRPLPRASTSSDLSPTKPKTGYPPKLVLRALSGIPPKGINGRSIPMATRARLLLTSGRKPSTTRALSLPPVGATRIRRTLLAGNLSAILPRPGRLASC